MSFNEHDLEEFTAAADAYEGLHVPALFEQWCPRVLDAARVAPGQRILDVACGTGALGRAAMARVGTQGFVSGLDPDPGMLAVAKRIAPTVEWRQGNAESLPYPDGSFDAVVSQFGLMFFRDRHLALREMLRVLGPAGHVAVAVWDALENSAAYSIEVDLLERMAGHRAADAMRAPFALGNTQVLTGLFTDAGFASVSTTTRSGTARFPCVRTMVEADLRGWLPVMGVVLEEERIQTILAEAEVALRDFVAEDGQVVFELSAHIISCGAD